MYLVFKDGSRSQTKPGSNITFDKNQYVVRWIDTDNVIHGRAVSELIQIEN